MPCTAQGAAITRCSNIAQHMHSTCTAHTQRMHTTCTAHAQHMHSTCTVHAQQVTGYIAVIAPSQHRHNTVTATVTSTATATSMAQAQHAPSAQYLDVEESDEEVPHVERPTVDLGVLENKRGKKRITCE